MRRTRILTVVLALAAGLLAGGPPALAAGDAPVPAGPALAADTYTWKNARIDGGGGDDGGTDPDPDPDPQPSGGCAVTYTVTHQWADSFQAEVRLTNTGTAAWDGWTLTWSFADGQRIAQLWNGAHTQSGPSVTVRDTGWNGTVAAGSSAGFGFTASRSAANTEPAAFELDGRTCTVR